MGRYIEIVAIVEGRAEQTFIEKIREECFLFDSWLTTLETIQREAG